MRFVSFRFLPIHLAFATLLLFRARTFEEATTVDLLTVHRVIALPLAIFFAGGYLALRGMPRRWPRAFVFFAAYIGIGTVSATLSPLSVYSYWKLTEMLMVLAVGLYVLRVSQLRPEFAAEAYEAWLAFMSVLVVAAIVGAVLLPGDALKPPVSEETLQEYGAPLLPVQLSGVLLTVNPNSLGAMAALLLLVNVGRHWATPHGPRRGRGRRLVWIGLLAGVLVLAQSRTAWIGLAVATMTALWFSGRLSVPKKLLAFGTVAAALVLSFERVSAYLTRGTSLEHLAALTGRAAWWRTAVGEVLNADLLGQLFGLGFMTANRRILSEHFASDAASLHSDYVDALVSAGLVGAFCLAMAVLALVAAVRAPSRLPRGELVGVVSILVVRSFTGTTFAIHNLFIPALVFIPVLCAAYRAPARRPRAFEAAA
jgi:hypothetical protein